MRKNDAREVGADIYFGDAAHMRSDHHAGRTWGKKGETPIVEATGARHGQDGESPEVLAKALDLFNKIRHSGLRKIENGVDIRKYCEAGAKKPTKAILSLSRFSNNKRLDRLIDFIAALRCSDSQWTLRLVGRPYDLHATSLKALAARAGVTDAVDVIESPSIAKIFQFMNDCSVYASASEYEGFGIAAVEAMSAGLFPVLSDISPHGSLINGTDLGLVVNFEDPKAAAALLIKKWSNFTNVTYMETRSKLMNVSARYDWQHKYSEFYDFALGIKVITILGVPIGVFSFNQAKVYLDTIFGKSKGELVVFANAHTLKLAANNPKFCQILEKAIVLNDGIAVELASRFLFRSGFPENLNGTDFIPNYLRETSNRYRIFLLGAKPSIAAKAALALANLALQHSIAGHRDGYFESTEIPGIVEKIPNSKADLLLVAMGSLRQEAWLEDHLSATGCRLGFGVGTLFDFLAGQVPRAPEWVRNARLEWVYRLKREPRRLFQRYDVFGAPAFVIRIMLQWLSGARV